MIIFPGLRPPSLPVFIAGFPAAIFPGIIPPTGIIA
jgi:hypothetical protein